MTGQLRGSTSKNCSLKLRTTTDESKHVKKEKTYMTPVEIDDDLFVRLMMLHLDGLDLTTNVTEFFNSDGKLSIDHHDVFLVRYRGRLIFVSVERFEFGKFEDTTFNSFQDIINVLPEEPVEVEGGAEMLLNVIDYPIGSSAYPLYFMRVEENGKLAVYAHESEDTLAKKVAV